jgi:hypothetical protein
MTSIERIAGAAAAADPLQPGCFVGESHLDRDARTTRKQCRRERKRNNRSDRPEFLFQLRLFTWNSIELRDDKYRAGRRRARYRLQRVHWAEEFGNGNVTLADVGSGDLVAISGSGGVLSVPSGYASDNPLSDTATYDTATFSGLGVSPGSYVWTWGSGAHADSFTLQIGPAAVPESSSLLPLAGGTHWILFACTSHCTVAKNFALGHHPDSAQRNRRRNYARRPCLRP